MTAKNRTGTRHMIWGELRRSIRLMGLRLLPFIGITALMFVQIVIVSESLATQDAKVLSSLFVIGGVKISVWEVSMYCVFFWAVEPMLTFVWRMLKSRFGIVHVPGTSQSWAEVFGE